MPRDLFGDVTSPRTSVSGRKWYSVPLSLLAHVALLVPLVLAPLLATDILPAVHDYVVFTPAGVVPPEPPPPPQPTTPDTPARQNSNAAPTEAPDHIAPEPVMPADVADPIEYGVPGGVPGSGVVIGEPPPPPPPAPVPPKPLIVGGKVRPPAKIRDAAPVYPPIAQAARVQGTVILQATIGADGRVQDLKVLRSIPLLDQAAIDAVRQWEYSATLLNNVPVPVIMTVTVTFTLNPDIRK
jgi:protein TonB